MKNSYFHNKEILIIGGTGTLGRALLKLFIIEHKPKGVRIFARNEYGHWAVRNEYGGDRISYLIGDIRDEKRLGRAMNGVDYVINCAALKHIDMCEVNPFEAKKTNIDGVENVINCAINNNVKHVLHVSTDKSVYPVNLYGYTKAVGEKLMMSAWLYCGNRIKFSCCRYGNVLGSRGSIVELFYDQYQNNNYITLTDTDMTRFWIEIDDVARFILSTIEISNGQEIHIPRMSSMKVVDIAKVIGNVCETKVIGMRKGEKLHECLVTIEESYNTEILKDRYIIYNNYYNPLPFTYTSNNNNLWLSENDIKDKLQRYLKNKNGR